MRFVRHESPLAAPACTRPNIAQIFLGSLRDIEQELIRERLSSAIMESLLALTIFREEFSGFFVAMFAGLVFVKVLHWLVQDRVDYIEVTPSVSRLQHLRIVSFMSVLLVRRRKCWGAEQGRARSAWRAQLTVGCVQAPHTHAGAGLRLPPVHRVGHHR